MSKAGKHRMQPRVLTMTEDDVDAFLQRLHSKTLTTQDNSLIEGMILHVIDLSIIKNNKGKGKKTKVDEKIDEINAELFNNPDAAANSDDLQGDDAQSNEHQNSSIDENDAKPNGEQQETGGAQNNNCTDLPGGTETGGAQNNNCTDLPGGTEAGGAQNNNCTDLPGGTETGGKQDSNENATGNAIPGSAEDPKEQEESKEREPKAKAKAKGHGRFSSDDYPNAQQNIYAPPLAIGSKCPKCLVGRLYPDRDRIIIEFIAQSPLTPIKHIFRALRCRICGYISTGKVRHDLVTLDRRLSHEARAHLCYLHYMMGVPFTRLEKLQNLCHTPVADATQWEVVEGVDSVIQPLFTALEQYAANDATYCHVDDTGIRIISEQNKIEQEQNEAKAQGKPETTVRTGVNTTGILVATVNGPVQLFYSGRHHSGEILASFLSLRSSSLPLPIMSDAASKNYKHSCAESVIHVNCHAHAYLQFDKIKDDFPIEAGFVLDIYKQIYDIDRNCRENAFSPPERKNILQQDAKPLFQRLLKWIVTKFQAEVKDFEPNSSLGKAMRYVMNHWQKLMAAFDQHGPLDNNVLESAFLVIDRYRNNSRQYRTEKGANVGDRLMSLLKTCESQDVHPIEYLTWCLKNESMLQNSPSEFFPWLYKQQQQQQNEQVAC